MSDTATAQRPTILIVEDDDNLRNIVGFRLEKAGYHIIDVDDGQKALEHLRKADLVLLNLGLPRISGLDIIRHMRSSGIYTPILVISGNQDMFDEVEKYDIVEIIPKPFDMPYLLDRVEKALKLNHKLEVLEQKAVSLTSTIDSALMALQVNGFIGHGI